MTSYTQTCTETLTLDDVVGSQGIEGIIAIYVNNVRVDTEIISWNTRDFLGEIREAEVEIVAIDTDLLVNGATIKFYSGVSRLFFKGVILKVEYLSEETAKLYILGSEYIFKTKEVTSTASSTTPTDTVDILYDNVNMNTIFTEQVGSLMTIGSTLQTAVDGNQIKATLRGQFTNKWQVLKELAYIARADLHVTHHGLQYDTDKINITEARGNSDYITQGNYFGNPVFEEQTPVMTITTSGSGANAVVASYEIDRDKVINKLTVLGAGDGENQLTANWQHSSSYRATLSDSFSSIDTGLMYVKNPTGFVSGTTYTVWVGQEKMTARYDGIVTGLTNSGWFTVTARGVGGTTAYTHNSGAAVYGTADENTPDAGTSIALYGTRSPNKVPVKKSIKSQDTLDRYAAALGDAQFEPVKRIIIKPDNLFTILNNLVVGDWVTVVDADTTLNDDYRIVGMICRSVEGEESIELQLSSARLQLIDELAEEDNKAVEPTVYQQHKAHYHTITAQNTVGQTWNNSYIVSYDRIFNNGKTSASWTALTGVVPAGFSNDITTLGNTSSGIVTVTLMIRNETGSNQTHTFELRKNPSGSNDLIATVTSETVNDGTVSVWKYQLIPGVSSVWVTTGDTLSWNVSSGTMGTASGSNFMGYQKMIIQNSGDLRMTFGGGSTSTATATTDNI